MKSISASLRLYAVLSLFILPCALSRDATDRPNFIVLFMDDLGYGDLGFTGHPTTKTPNLDKLAWNGKILTTWYSGCSACTGSRAALMTGRQWPRTGLPIVLGPTGNTGLPLNETTVAEQLKSVGYATAAVGKWHLGQRQVYLPGNRGACVFTHLRFVRAFVLPTGKPVSIILSFAGFGLLSFLLVATWYEY
jgi:arylsulfatase A